MLTLTIGEHITKPENSFTPDIPGGLVDPGETEYDAVLREIYEEVGLQISRDDIELVYSGTKFYPDENKSVSRFLFLTRIVGDCTVNLSVEHSDYRWVPIDDLGSIELTEFYRSAIEYVCTNGILQ